MVAVAREKGIRRVYVPPADAAEAALVEGIDVIPVQALGELVSHLRGEVAIPPEPCRLGLLDHEAGVDGRALVRAGRVKWRRKGLLGSRCVLDSVAVPVKRRTL